MIFAWHKSDSCELGISCQWESMERRNRGTRKQIGNEDWRKSVRKPHQIHLNESMDNWSANNDANRICKRHAIVQYLCVYCEDVKCETWPHVRTIIVSPQRLFEAVCKSGSDVIFSLCLTQLPQIIQWTRGKGGRFA